MPLGDLTVVSQAILELLDDPKVRQLQGQIGREYVQRYDYREMALKELEYLKSLCIA